MNSFDEELVCVDSLAHYLKTYCGCGTVEVRRESSDPPDFWIDIDSQEYAAEVTSIVIEQGYHAVCTAFKDSLKNSAMSEDIIKGSYCLQLTRQPKIPRKKSTQWRDLSDRALSFIRDTSSIDSPQKVLLLNDNEGQLSIRKTNSDGATVGLFGEPRAKWEEETHLELQGLLQDAVSTKRKKLEKKGVQNQCPRIFLVLYDAYGYGDVEDAKKALMSTNDYDWFHSIFWATSFTDRRNDLYPGSPGREGTFLYSKNDKWLRIK